MPRENHSVAEWEQQINTVAKLYLDDKYDHEDIAKHLTTRGFPTS